MTTSRHSSPTVSHPVPWACCVAIVAVLVGSVASASRVVAAPLGGGDDDVPRMLQRLERLEQRLDALAARDAEGWLTPERARQVRSLVTAVLADADRRSALLDEEVLAGYRKRIFLQSADGDFELQFWGYFQQRYSASLQRSSPDRDDVRSGFEIRRAKLKTAGRLFGDRLRFTANVAYDEDTEAFGLEGTTIQYQLSEQTHVKLGRFRSPLLREEQVSSRRNQLAERSLVSRAFVQNRTLGVAIVHQGETWAVDAAVMASRENLARGQNWILAVRGVGLLYGRMKDLRDFSSFRGDDPLLAIGGGLYFQDEMAFGDELVDFDRFRWTADLTWETPGASLFAAVTGNHERRPADGLDQYGVVLQGGVFVSEQVELVARYEWGDADRDVADLSVISLGVNWYVDEHDLKFTADVGYGINPVESPWDSDGASWRRDRPGKNGQIVVRGQWVLQF